MNIDCNLPNVQTYLPHRKPMLMVDTLLELSKERVVSTFQIQENTLFIHHDTFSEAGLIENIAQTCSCIVGQSFFEDSEKETKLIGFITNIKKIQIFSLPKVNDILVSRASLLSQFENICNLYSETYKGDELLIKAEINLFIQEIKP